MKLKIIILGFLFHSCLGFGQFITEWNTGAFTTITVPTIGTGYNYTATIAKLDAPTTIITTLTGVTGNAVFSGLTVNTAYEVKITGAFPRIHFNNGGDKLKLKAVTQWGNIAWTSFANAFFGCTTLNVTATDIPVLTGVTSMSQMFRFCAALNGPANIGSWNTSTITDMSFMFGLAGAFNQNVSGWNTASVTNMASLFGGATAFNQSIGNWNTSAVTDMNYMFFGATAFNQNIGNWDTSHVINMNGMFSGATAFNQSLNGWNTSAVTNMSSMFTGATAFNQAIGNWNTGSVTNMNNMFGGATAFNQNIGNWNTSAVTDMSTMFANATNFNQNIGTWNVSSVGNMNAMFKQATAFNQDIGNWNTSAAWNMFNMFLQATAFNQDISGWNISSATSMDAMFKQATSFDQNLAAWGVHLNPNVILGSFAGGFLDNCGMSVANYDATLIGFKNTAPNGLTMGAVAMYYCNDGAAARASLVLPVASGGKGWVITGDISLAASTPILATSGTTANLTPAGCNEDWSNPANRARKMLVIDTNGNDLSPSAVVINHKNIGTLPSGITSVDGYYQISNATNSTRISNRLTSIVAPGDYAVNGGVIVRVYYSVLEYTNIVVNAPPVGEIIDAGWFLTDIDNAAGVVANMSAGTPALEGSQKIIPFNSGSENGIAFVEFKIKKMGTIGLYAKTTEGNLLTPDFGKNLTIGLYPNPAENLLNIKLPNETIAVQQLLITNMLGQTVFHAVENLSSIDISSLKTGMYQIVLNSDAGDWNGKFIKK